MTKEKNNTEKNESEPLKRDTVVEVHFPEKIEIELVQANELRHYEIFTWFASLLATVAVGFWVAYFTTNPKSGELFWTAVVATLIFTASLAAAFYYRSRVYHGSLIKNASLSEFKSKIKN